MEKKNKRLMILVAAAVILFCAICFVIIPDRERRQAVYERNQQDALTHDIAAVENCRTPYLGDAVNVGRLFEQLPLGRIEKKYEIDSEKCALTVTYLEPAWEVGEEKLRRDLVYNAVAAMASIENLSAVSFELPEYHVLFTRVQMEDAFGNNLSSFLEEGVWKERVQDPIADKDFLKQFYLLTSKSY